MTLRKTEQAIKKGDVSSVYKMIAKFAHQTFAKLPFTYQSIWSIEDLIALGINHTVTTVLKEYRLNRKDAKVIALFSTYLFVALENLYKDLLKEAYRDKRNVAVFSMDSQVSYKGQLIEAGALVARYADFKIEEHIVNRVDAERAFLKVYEKASPKLRKHLINWCIQPKNTKYKLTGGQFKAVLKEFRKNKFGNILSSELIRTIQNDALCRNRVVIGILGVPKIKVVGRRIIGVEGQVTGFQTQVRKNRPSLEVQLLADAVL